MPKANRLLASFKWFLLLLAILLALLACGVWWLTAAPRELTQVSAAIIERLQPANAPFEVRVGSVAFEWKSWHKPAHMRLDGIEIISSIEPNSSLHIPHGGVNLKMLPLLWGSVQIEELQLFGLNAALHSDETALHLHDAQGNRLYSIARNVAEQAKPNPNEWVANAFIAAAGLAFDVPVQTITLQSDSLAFTDEASQQALQLQQSVLSVRKHGDSKISAELRTELHLPSQSVSSLALSAQYDMQQNVGSGRLLFDILNPMSLCGLALDCSKLPQLDMPLAGGVQLTMQDTQPHTLTITLDGGQGTLAFAPHLPEVIALSALHADAQLNLIDRTLILPSLTLAMQTGTRIEASGKAQYPNEQLSLELKARAEQMPVDHLARYWPQGLAPATREWATTNIRSGMATEAETTISLTPDDLQTEFLPDDFLQARIEVENSTVNYLPQFPKAEEVKATVYFTGKTMRADIHEAKAFSSVQLAGSSLVMSDMNADGTPMVAALDLKASAQDVAQIMAKLPNSSLQEAATMLQEATSGTIAGQMELGFNAFGGDASSASDAINWDALRYDIKAKLDDVADVLLHKALPKQTLSGSISADNNAFSIALDGKDETSIHRIELAQKQGEMLQWSWRNTLVASGDAAATAQAKTLLQDASGRYAHRDGITQLEVKGSLLDLSAFLEEDEDEAAAKNASEDGFRLSELPAFNLDVDIAALTVSQGQTLRQVKGALHCPSRCEPSKISAQFENGGSLVFQIARDGLQRVLKINSNRLGDTLRLIDSEGKVFEGALEVRGVYNDALPQSTVTGTITMSDFFLRDAPIIGRILNAGSLVGLLDTLKGDGIKFDKLTSDFSFSSDVLRLKDGKASGAAMGLLIDGDINLGTNMIDVSGNLAPAHVLNSLVGKVPIIGDLIVGGDGESVFAINYSVRGDMDDPSVTVNPLSALTPGFTRRFFDVFEGERNTEEQTQTNDSLAPAEAIPDQPAPTDSKTKWQTITP